MNITQLRDDLHVASMPLGPIQTNTHILYQNNNALVIDAPPGSLASISGFLRSEKLELHALLLTHGHWDHIGDATALSRKYQRPVYGSRLDQQLFRNPQLMSAFAGDFDLVPIDLDVELALDFRQGPRQSVLKISSWPELAIEALAMPGHTPGGIAFYFPQAACAMTGDQLFRESVGRSDFPGGDFALLSASIRSSLYQLPGQTMVLPGHGAATSIGYEMQHNPFVPAL